MLIDTDQVKDDGGVLILSLDFQKFRKICDVELFFETLEEKPRMTLSCMTAAVHKVQAFLAERFNFFFFFRLSFSGARIFRTHLVLERFFKSTFQVLLLKVLQVHCIFILESVAIK